MMELIPKRAIPDDAKRSERSRFFSALEQRTSSHMEYAEAPRFDEGNGKTGQSGRLLDRVFVWNLPPLHACPGRSRWCYENCYNADSRDDIYPIERWQQNLWWAKEKPTLLKQCLTAQLDTASSYRVGVRIHSSGDFFAASYVDLWREIAEEFPSVIFWAYTRSWVMPALREAIQTFAELSNVTVIFSWDVTMQEPPEGWPLSIVASSIEELERYACVGNSWICPEQFDLVAGCADCGLCFGRHVRSIVFLEH